MQTLKSIRECLFWFIAISLIAGSCIGWKIAYEENIVLSSYFLSGGGYSREIEFESLRRLYLVSYLNSSVLFLTAVVLIVIRLKNGTGKCLSKNNGAN